MQQQTIKKLTSCEIWLIIFVSLFTIASLTLSLCLHYAFENVNYSINNTETSVIVNNTTISTSIRTKPTKTSVKPSKTKPTPTTPPADEILDEVDEGKIIKRDVNDFKNVNLKSNLYEEPLKYANKIYKFPYLVSLNKLIWVKGILSNASEYQCSGIIATRNAIITGPCVADEEWLKLTVRAGSDFHSIGGSLHKITSTSKIGPFITAKVQPYFNFENYVKPARFLSDDKDWNYAKLIGWAKGSMELQKYKSFDEKIVTKLTIFDEICSEKNISRIGNILVQNDEILMMVVKNSCENFSQNYFAGFQNIYSNLQNIL